MTMLENLTTTFVEIDVPGTPVRVFEPIKIELADHSVVEVVRVDNRVSAQLGAFLTVVDVPNDMEDHLIVDHVRNAFGAAKGTVQSVTAALDCDRSTTISIGIESDGRGTTISCSNNI